MSRSGCGWIYERKVAKRKCHCTEEVGHEKLQEADVPYNSGWAGELRKGQVIRIIATTTVDFVCMRLDNLKERFDQARTKSIT
jgi:hypothetical protein